MLMRRPLIISVVIVIALSNACKKEVAPRASEQNKNQTGANVNATSQNLIAGTAEPNSNSRPASFKPKTGYVPDEQTAIAIGVAVWIPIYGREEIESEKPFRATLKNGVWTVSGTLPEGYSGGTAVAEIAQDDGRVLRVTHYQ
jgi:hypothetical protein